MGEVLTTDNVVNINELESSTLALTDAFPCVDVEGNAKKVTFQNVKDNFVFDTALSTTSTNGVQNKVVATELNKKQTTLAKERFYCQRNNNTNKYVLICSFDITSLTGFSSPLVFEGFIGSNSTAQSNSLFKLLINPRNGVENNFFVQGFISDSSSFNYSDIVITKDENNICYVYAEFTQGYGLIDFEIKKTLNAYQVNTKKTLLETMTGTEVVRMSTAKNIVSLLQLNERITALETALNTTTE